MSKIKIALADDNKQFKKAMKALFKTEQDLEIIIDADDGIHLLEQLKTERPDIILMDIRMPKLNGIETSKKIIELYPKIKVIAFSQYDYESNIVQMYTIGVKSFIGKGDSPGELLKAIRTVKDGGLYMPNHAAEIIQKHFVNTSIQMENNVKFNDLEFLEKLRNSELELLWQVATHKSVSEIANVFSVSPNTINNRQAFLRKKLNLYGKGKLLQYALSIKQYLKQFIEWRNKNR